MFICGCFFVCFLVTDLNGNLDSPLSILGKLGFIAGILIIIDFFVDLGITCENLANEAAVANANTEIIFDTNSAMIGKALIGVIVLAIAGTALGVSAAKKKELENEKKHMKSEETEHADWF